MFEFIIELLIDIGLISSDWKHRKRVEKEEQITGKSQPFKKFFGQPSVIVIFVVLLLTPVFTLGYFTYRDRVLNVKNTQNEMSEILTRIRKYEAKDIKITSIDSLIIARPLLKKWRTDSWQTEYRIIRNQTTSLQSAGRDRIFNTNDDIYSE